MVRHCIRRQCFILLPNVWVVFKIYFAILHKIVARNNVQQSIRLNKRKRKKKSFRVFALHPVSHVTHCRWDVRFEHKAAWKRCDICERCVVIFRNVQPNLNVHRRFSQILRLYDDIIVLVYAESFKSIGMLANKASFCYAVDLKFVQMLA